MKYVIFEKPDTSETIRVFEDWVDHSQIVQEVLGKRPGLKVKSAGKFRLSEDIFCRSGSVTLDIKFNNDQSQEDSEMVTRFFTFQI